MADALHRFIVTNGARLVRSLERRIATASTIGNTPFFDAGGFPWTRTLEAGAPVMVLDDNCVHQVWNHTDGVRAVLFLDIVRPLRVPMRQVNAFILKLIARSPFIRDAETNCTRWEQEFDRTAATS